VKILSTVLLPMSGSARVLGQRIDVEGAGDAMLALATVILGRITTITAIGLIGFFEVWAVGRLMFGVSISFEPPVALVSPCS